MKIFSKQKFIKDGKLIKKYKFCDITMLRKEKSPTKKKWNLLGVKVCQKNKQIKIENNIIDNNIIDNSDFPKANCPLYSNRVAIIGELTIPQCMLYRVTNKIKALEKLGYIIDVSDWRDNNSCFSILQIAKFVIFYRTPYFDNVKKYYLEAKRLGLKIVFDCDDLIFYDKKYKEYLDKTKLSQKAKNELLFGCSLYKQSLINSDYFWSSTKELKQQAKRFIQNTCIVPNCIPNNLLEISKLTSKNYSNESDIIKIFYGSGSNTHDDDFKQCQKALNDVLLKYDNVELFIHGDLVTEDFDKKIHHKIHKIGLLNAEDYYYAISMYDIAVAPLQKDVFSNCKSNIKYIEASIFSIPCIASNLQEWTNVITNGVNGYIATNYEEWLKYLCELIEKRELRQSIGYQSYKNILKLYSLDNNAQYLKKAIDKLRLPMPKKHNKVLWVNVLYGYSSFGGATIVSEQLAEEFNKYENWESYIFTCHPSKRIDNLVRYKYKNIPVFSVGIPEVTLDYKNTKITKKFDQVIKLIRPDIVHFHSIQGMGIDMMNICKEYNIPYTLTMHDAWFVCPRQFMIDSNNKFCDQKFVTSEICHKRCKISFTDYYHRKLEINKVLVNAAKIYTPSKSFCYQLQSNFPFVRLYENINGIDILPQKKVKNNCNEIVFGFFAGNNPVKGYDLIKEVLNLPKYKNWKIILIDAAMKFGVKTISKTDFGNNAEILGFVDHKKMVNIYNSIDVLLFPSNWNESFGLMVREAIACNCFVICSECGGPSSAIKNGENGLVFPKGNKQKFAECLDWVFEHKSYIKQYVTKNFGDICTYSEQAKKLKIDFENIFQDNDQ